MPSDGVTIDNSFRVDVIDHVHDDESVPMDVVESSDGQAHNGAIWLRAVMQCPECKTQMVLIVRQKTRIGETPAGP